MKSEKGKFNGGAYMLAIIVLGAIVFNAGPVSKSLQASSAALVSLAAPGATTVGKYQADPAEIRPVAMPRVTVIPVRGQPARFASASEYRPKPDSGFDRAAAAQAQEQDREFEAAKDAGVKRLMNEARDQQLAAQARLLAQ